MRVVVGLGNPGEEYEGSRHNAGFLVVAALARAHRIGLGAGRGDFVGGTGRVGGVEAMLVLPLTFMNESGKAVLQVLEAAEASAGDLLVACDDVNLPLGRLRIRAGGSDGGHKGLRSIISALGTELFPRLRLGVGAPPPGDDTAVYVLDDFTDSERAAVDDMVARAGDAVEAALALGLERAMTLYNRWERSSERSKAEESR